MSEQNYRNTSGSATREATLRDILTPLFRRRRLLILSFCGVFLGAIIASVLLSSRYEAQMEILVNRDRMDPVVTTEQFSQTSPAAPPLTEEEINSEVELLQSQDLLKEVVTLEQFDFGIDFFLCQRGRGRRGLRKLFGSYDRVHPIAVDEDLHLSFVSARQENGRNDRTQKHSTE